MSVSTTYPISSATSASSNSDTSARVPQKSLGQADFLKLLTTQLAHQDPSKPMDDASFIAQMAQFSTLQIIFSREQDGASRCRGEKEASRALCPRLPGRLGGGG